MPQLGTFVSNCVINNYSSGLLTMTATVSDFASSQTLTVLVRSGSGSGIIAISLTLGVSIQQPPWSNYILYKNKVSNPGWDKQLASFARPSTNAFSSAYTTFVRATFDSSLYTDTSGNSWSSSTGSVGNMVLKSEYYGQQSDIWLIKNIPISSCWVAPISDISGTGLSYFSADNGTSCAQFWDNSGSPGAFIRWGYTSSVTAKSVGMCLYVLSNWAGANITLKGFSSNSFTSGTTLVSFAASTIGTSFTGTNYTWHTLSTTGSFSHYELSGSTKHDHYTWPVILAE